MPTLQKHSLRSRNTKRLVHTLHQFVRLMPAIHEQWWAVPTLQKPYLCIPQIARGSWAVPTLQEPYLCIPQIARMVGGAHPTPSRPPHARNTRTMGRGAHPTRTKGWCAVHTLHKHSLRSRNTKRMVGGAHPTPIRPPHARNTRTMGRGAHQTKRR